METFTLIVLGFVVTCTCGICVWMVIKSRQADEAYDKAIDEIYGRKRK